MANRDTKDLLKIIERIHTIQDVSILLERILHEARRFVNADAATLYLVQDGKLFFNYIENDTLFKGGKSKNKYIYTDNHIPMNKNSLAGYAAVTGEALLIDDVYDIQSEVSYSFNPEFDKKSHYRTKSLLVVPLINSIGKVQGVIQLINAKDEQGEIVPFSGADRTFISYFALHAANAIEKANVSRDMIMRMVEMVELRDPFETVRHARRVGEMALNLYDRYAASKGVPESERIIKKDMFRAAAMLHDVGKVGVEGKLMAKSGGLSQDEKVAVYSHAIHGARLFRNYTSAWEKVAYEVVLNHHEHWDGSGYPGHISDVTEKNVSFGPGKRGKEIPLSGRIVAICDTYDSLTSVRAYKSAWTEGSAMSFIKSKSGKFFDPELVDQFMSMNHVLKSIKEKFPDEI